MTCPTNIILYLLIIQLGLRKMRVIITEHAKKRLNDYRQNGIENLDIIEAAKRIPGNIPVATRFRGNTSNSGRIFDIVAKDTSAGRLVLL